MLDVPSKTQDKTPAHRDQLRDRPIDAGATDLKTRQRAFQAWCQLLRCKLAPADEVRPAPRLPFGEGVAPSSGPGGIDTDWIDMTHHPEFTSTALPDLDGTDIIVPIPETFRLQSGERLDQGHAIARLYGPSDSPVVIAAGGISAGRVLFAKEDSTESAPGWWEGVAGPGAALDLNTWRVLSVEFAPLKPASRVYTLTTQDQARLIALILDHLNIGHIHAFVGASYGAMIGLAFAETYPDRVSRLCVISAAHRAHPMATAMRGMQRRLLLLGLETGHEREAISLARQLAMTTYRSEAEFLERFYEDPPASAGENYAVCTYLRSRGDAYTVSDAKRWICLSDSLDRHRVDPSRIRAHVTLAAVPNDRLVPYEEMQLLHSELAQAVLIDLPSLYGHDAFLKEIVQVSAIVRTVLEV